MPGYFFALRSTNYGTLRFRGRSLAILASDVRSDHTLRIALIDFSKYRHADSFRKAKNGRRSCGRLHGSRIRLSRRSRDPIEHCGWCV
ncbi:hypothetical protein BJV78DRAFT_877067 [Lactifluus subvellereus]|nr:hypothetical protein BJV78DRAFT_877067 [Lactifluus subvellereus]